MTGNLAQMKIFQVSSPPFKENNEILQGRDGE
jgi:hypothetical protein